MRIIAAVLALSLAACGATLPQAVMRGSYLESYGFECECGSHTFVIDRRTFTTFEVHCDRCGHEWIIRNGDRPVSSRESAEVGPQA